MIKKVIIASLIFSITLGNLAVLATPQKVEAATLKEALENLQLKGAEKSLEKAEEQEAKKLELSKNLVKLVIETVEKWLAVADTRLAANTHYSDNQRASMQSKLDEVKNWLAGVKSKVEAATTVDEVKSIAAQAKEEWATYKVSLKLIYIEAWVENGNKAIEKFEAVSLKIDEMIAGLEKDQLGVNTDELENLLTQLNSQIAESKAKINEALTNLDLMKTMTGEELTETFFSTRQLVIEAVVNLITEANKSIQDILKEVRSLVKSS